MSRRILGAMAVGLLLAAAIHTDWHFARPEHHRLSLGLSWHWLLAVPVFAPVAWYVRRVWPAEIARSSLWLIGGAVFVAGVVEPAWEYVAGGATFDWAFGRARTLTLATFTVTGIATYLAVLALPRRSKLSQSAD